MLSYIGVQILYIGVQKSLSLWVFPYIGVLFFKKKLLKKLHNSNNIVTFALCLRVHLFMKVSELWRMLERAGCTIHRRGGNHDIWYSPITGKKFPVSRHKTEDLKPKNTGKHQGKGGYLTRHFFFRVINIKKTIYESKCYY